MNYAGFVIWLLIFAAAGIPDFRSPSSGLYSKLCGFDLPYPEAIFEIEYFRKHPEPFFAMAKELYPKTFEPTPCHYFLRLLNKKGITDVFRSLNHDAKLAFGTFIFRTLIETLHSKCVSLRCFSAFFFFYFIIILVRIC